MNWHKGLHRIFVVVCIAWMVGVVIIIRIIAGSDVDTCVALTKMAYPNSENYFTSGNIE
jgi:hypothetical protein